MKKAHIYLFFLIITILCGCGIVTGKEKKAAQEYIEAKYGQNAKIVKSNKNYNLTGQGNGLPPTGIEADGTYNFVMEIDGQQFDVCLTTNDDVYYGYDNFEEELIKTNVTDDIENHLAITCDEVFLSYSKLYGKYGNNLIHEPFEDIKTLYESGKFAAIIATHDILDEVRIEKYASRFHINSEKSLFRIEIIQYKDTIPELSFSTFSDTTDSDYVQDWYTISRDDVKHHDGM